MSPTGADARFQALDEATSGPLSVRNPLATLGSATEILLRVALEGQVQDPGSNFGGFIKPGAIQRPLVVYMLG